MLIGSFQYFLGLWQKQKLYLLKTYNTYESLIESENPFICEPPTLESVNELSKIALSRNIQILIKKLIKMMIKIPDEN
jgi:hypothetical protein